MAYLAVLNTVGNQGGKTPDKDCYSTTLESWQQALVIIPPGTRLWLPFYMDGESKRIVESLGYKVVASPPMARGGDFFKYSPDPDSYDMIFDNPPFADKSVNKRNIGLLPRLMEIGKPWVIFYPLESIQQIGVRALDKIHNFKILMPDKHFTFIRGKDDKVIKMKNIVLYHHGLIEIKDKLGYISDNISRAEWL